MIRGALALAAGLSAAGAAGADPLLLEGHGGPVMDVTVAPDGQVATASFDNSVGLWNGTEPRWLEGHDAAVNAVAFLPGGGLASAADDFDVILWRDGAPSARLEGHAGKVMALAPEGERVASASWDGSARLWSAADGTLLQEFDGHDGPVNDVAFLDARTLLTASADGTVRVWDAATGTEARQIVTGGFGVNRMALAPDGAWLAYGTVDGTARVLDTATGDEIADLSAGRRPILALTVSPDGSHLAIGDGEGHILVARTGDWSVLHDFRATDRGPIWSLDFAPDGARLYAAGLDAAVHVWPLADLDAQDAMSTADAAFLTDPATVPNGERQFKRKCSVCHTLTGDGARRAGPTLAGLFGRPAGVIAGYPYSDALADSDVTWTAETVSALFEIGPAHYVPGTKMPMQRIAGAEDRADLIDYLRRETAPKE
ncbi:c-type cytochrome [Roseivivax marinus]|uniref:c-type cytochrome n=1 Tax=Roseivivax marinus TaxID=1379903 RepID=UPI00273D3FDA|nr:c-type cytochrome [Roseivivax marinus]